MHSRTFARISLAATLATAIAATVVSAQPLDAPAAPLPMQAADTPAAAGQETEWSHWTSGRYRVTPGDVLEFRFPFVPELDQTVTVQPDGFVTLKDVRDVKVQGRTLAQVKEDVLAAYEPVVRDPVFTIALTQFEKPYFIANGEVETPGRYELRGATTLTQALAFAGGASDGADMSEVLLVRRYGDRIEVKEVNVKRMLATRDLSEDPLLRPGDMIVVRKGVIGKLTPLLHVFRWGF